MIENHSFENGMQWAWDATSITAAMTCPRKYYYSMIAQIQPAELSVHLRFGGLYATALEHFYKHRAEGKAIDEALLLVVKEAMLATWTDNGPEAFGHPAKSRFGLIRSIVWYVDQFGEESSAGIQTHHLANGKPAVELSFSFEISDDIMFCGHLDRVVTYAGQKYVMDQKAQPLRTKVLGPTGWKKIGDLSIGDLVATQSGEFVPIIALHPKGITKVYKVSFNDGESVLCAEDHLWEVAPRTSDEFKTLPLTKLLGAPPTVRYHIPLCKPIQHPTADLPLHPYLLGVLLGDGYLNGNSIQLSTTKQWLVDRVTALLPTGDVIKKASKFNNSWTISGGATLAAIRHLGLWGKLAASKFVPSIYLYADIEQRQELLDGLLDTDGSWNGKSRIFDSTSMSLTLAVEELTRSLGGTARSRDRGDTAWRTSIRLPTLPTGTGRRYITSIIRVEDEETMCISVDDPSGLYVTEKHIVTHNTTGGTIGPYFFDQFRMDNQMSLYTLAGQAILNSPIKGVLIDGAQIAVGFTRFERGFTYRTKEQLDEWLETALEIIHRTRSYTALGKFPMNLSACGNYGGCPFKKICETTPSHRDEVIKAEFRPKLWDPLSRR